MNINGPKGADSPATALAGAAIKKGHAVKRGADVEHVITGTLAAQCLGIATDDQDTAERTVPYAYRPGERVYAVAGGAFAVDTYLKSDANGKLITAAAGDFAIAVSREAAGADLDIVAVEVLPLDRQVGLNPVVGTAGGLKVARGQQLTVAAADTIVTGLATVVAVVASLDSDPVDNPEWVTATIGDQAGAPVAGSIIVKTWQNTAGNDPTPTAATAFGKKVNWIAIGT